MADVRPDLTPQQIQYIEGIVNTLGGVKTAVGAEATNQNNLLKNDLSLARQAIFEAPELQRGFSTATTQEARSLPMASLEREQRVSDLERGQNQRLMQAMISQQAIQASFQLENRFKDINFATALEARRNALAEELAQDMKPGFLEQALKVGMVTAPFFMPKPEVK